MASKKIIQNDPYRVLYHYDHDNDDHDNDDYDTDEMTMTSKT